ncbi:MAG: mechanosensitive ion channel [Chlorobi bacterium]|nr:mechanosensitive ion channel [Chlorobiota bacterium]
MVRYKHFIFLVILLWVSTIMFSQDTQSVARDVVEKVMAPRKSLIPAVDMPNRLPDATNKVKAIKKNLISQEELMAKKAELDEYLAGLREFREVHNVSKRKPMDRSRLQNELYYWNKEKERLLTIQSDFDKLKNKLIEQKKDLNEIRDLWVKSLEASKGKSDLSRNTKRMVNSLLNEINGVEYALNQKIDFVFKELELITNTIISLNENIELIQSKLDNLTETLLFTKEPSLFAKIFKKDYQQDNSDSKYSLSDIYSPIVNYIEENLILLIGHLLLFIVLYILLRIIKNRINIDKYNKINLDFIHITFKVLSRPLSASFMIALLSAHIIYADSPPIFKTLIFFLLLIPVMIILPAITVKKLNVYIYGLGLIYMLTLFLRLELVGEITSYLIIISAIFVMLFGIYKFISTNIIREIFFVKVFRHVITLMFYVFAFLLVIAFFSMLIGYYALGVFLFDNTVWSIYRFFLFYAAYVVVGGFVEMFMFSDYARKLNSVTSNIREILSAVNRFLLVVMILLLLNEVFSLFKVDRVVGEFLLSVWTFEIHIGQIVITLGNILTLIITLWVSNVLAKIISTFLEKDVLNRVRLKRGVPRTISILAKYTILTVGFLIAIAAAGMELSNFTIIMGALGVGIGFGLQDIINNFISGLILLFERPIQVGDKVQIDDLWGTVINIGIRSSIIRTFDGSEVIVPNGMLISREVTNWTLSDQKRRLEIEVGVEYGADLKKVLEILINSAQSHPDVMKNPPPAAWFIGFGSSSVDFKLVFWHPSFDGSFDVKSQVAITVFDELEKAGITIPFPQQDLYIKEIKQQDVPVDTGRKSDAATEKGSENKKADKS